MTVTAAPPHRLVVDLGADATILDAARRLAAADPGQDVVGHRVLQDPTRLAIRRDPSDVLLVAIGRIQRAIERGQHLADRQILGAIDRSREIPPEVPQHLFPIDAPARHVVELVFEVCGKIVLDVALEEVRQKCRD